MTYKIGKHLFAGLHIETLGIKNIKTMINEGNRKTRIIYMPIYKSYTDLFLLSFIQFHQNMELGFTFGNYEDTPKWDWSNRLIKRLGLI